MTRTLGLPSTCTDPQLHESEILCAGMPLILTLGLPVAKGFGPCQAQDPLSPILAALGIIAS